MPRTSTKKPAGLSQHTLAQLDAKKQQAEAALDAAKVHLAAIKEEEKRRADAAQHDEELRLGKLAYAAGLAGKRPSESALAFEQLGRLVQDPLGWTRFICGDLVDEWLGPPGTVHVLQIVGDDGKPLVRVPDEKEEEE